jgi:hypothetical protein
MYFAVSAAGRIYRKDETDNVKEKIIGFSGWFLAEIFLIPGILFWKT